MTPRQRAILRQGKRSRAWCIDCDWAEAPSTAQSVALHIVSNPRHIVVHDHLHGVAQAITIVRRSADA